MMDTLTAVASTTHSIWAKNASDNSTDWEKLNTIHFLTRQSESAIWRRKSVPEINPWHCGGTVYNGSENLGAGHTASQPATSGWGLPPAPPSTCYNGWSHHLTFCRTSLSWVRGQMTRPAVEGPSCPCLAITGIAPPLLNHGWNCSMFTFKWVVWALLTVLAFRLSHAELGPVIWLPVSYRRHINDRCDRAHGRW